MATDYMFRDKKNYNTKLSEKLQKYQQYHQVKLINMNILQTKEYYLPFAVKFTYSALGKALQKQAKEQVDTLNSLNLFNKIDEIIQIQGIFSKNQLNDLIIDKLIEINQLQNNIKINDLEYTTKR